MSLALLFPTGIRASAGSPCRLLPSAREVFRIDESRGQNLPRSFRGAGDLLP